MVHEAVGNHSDLPHSAMYKVSTKQLTRKLKKGAASATCADGCSKKEGGRKGTPQGGGRATQGGKRHKTPTTQTRDQTNAKRKKENKRRKRNEKNEEKHNKQNQTTKRKQTERDRSTLVKPSIK